jgi:hypothetical protein
MSKQLPLQRLIAGRMARFRKGLLVIAGVATVVALFVSCVSYARTKAAMKDRGIHDRSPSLVGGLLVGGVLPGAGFFGGAWLVGHLATKRGIRLATQGRRVIGRLVGTPSVWNAELLPGGANFAAPRRVWNGAMHLSSAFLPTLRHTCEIEIDGKTQQVHAGIFCDEEPLVALHGEIMVVVLDGRGPGRFPSPWLVCQTGDRRTDDAITAVLEGLAVDDVRPAA